MMANVLLYLLPVLIMWVRGEHFASMGSSADVSIFTFYALCLLPVLSSVIEKLNNAKDPTRITDGTFCFRPSIRLRFNRQNLSTLGGIALEFAQHAFFCLPYKAFTGDGLMTKLRGIIEINFSVKFSLVFWACVAMVVFVVVIMILRVVLTGQKAYRLNQHWPIWLIVYGVSGPLFISIVSTFVFALSCDYDPALKYPVLIQDSDIECWKGEHINMASMAFLALAYILTQATVLPAGTYKETMRSEDLDILYVPVYLQGHFLLKAVFSGVYAATTLYDENVRISMLTSINILILILNVYVQPCSLQSVNRLRTTCFSAAVWVGVSSLVWLQYYDENAAADCTVDGRLLLTFCSCGCALIFADNFRDILDHSSARYNAEKVFFEMEQQQKENITIDSRCFESLIALTLSTKETHKVYSKDCAVRVIKLLENDSIRVQFQSCWVLANIAKISNEHKKHILENDGVALLFKLAKRHASDGGIWLSLEDADDDLLSDDGHGDDDFYDDDGDDRDSGAKNVRANYLSNTRVLNEALAALVNVLAEPTAWPQIGPGIDEDQMDMVPFFVALLEEHSIKKHALSSSFAAMALTNIALDESCRLQILRCGGQQALLKLALSKNHSHQYHACCCLANMAFEAPSAHSVFYQPALIRKILKASLSPSLEVRDGVLSLLLNLSFHDEIMAMLIKHGAIEKVSTMRSSAVPHLRSRAQFLTDRFLKAKIEQNFGGKVAVPTSTAGGGVNIPSFVNPAGAEDGGEAMRRYSTFVSGYSTGGPEQHMQDVKVTVDWATWFSRMEQLDFLRYGTHIEEHKLVPDAILANQENSQLIGSATGWLIGQAHGSITGKEDLFDGNVSEHGSSPSSLSSTKSRSNSEGGSPGSPGEEKHGDQLTPLSPSKLQLLDGKGGGVGKKKRSSVFEAFKLPGTTGKSAGMQLQVMLIQGKELKGAQKGGGNPREGRSGTATSARDIYSSSHSHSQRSVMKGVSTLSRAVTAAQERNPNPFVCLRVGDQLQLARVVRKTIAPVWGQVFNFQAQGENELLLEVWDKTIIGKPTFLGQAVINLAVIKPNVDERLWVELTDRAPTTGDTRSTTRADGASSPSGEEEDIYSSSNGQGSGAGMSVWGRSAQKAARSFRGELELVIHLLQGKHSRGLSVESVELPSDRPSV
jgi:hypothetical protein